MAEKFAEDSNMATDRTFGSMLNQKPAKGLGGMRMRSLSFGQENKRKKNDQPLNLWAKMLEKEKK